MKENQKKLYESILSEIESGQYKQLVKGYGKDPQGTAEKIEKLSPGTQQASGILKDVRMDAKRAGAKIYQDKSEHSGMTHANTGEKVDAKGMFDAVMADTKNKPIGESFTRDELKQLFEEVGLDTKKYTLEYLADKLGFEKE